MGDCCKRLDGLGGGMSASQTSGDVPDNLTVQGDIIVGPGPDGWGNVRSANAANGLDLEAPAGKRIRLLNGTKSWVEVDVDGLEIHAPDTGVVGLKVPNLTTDYDFILPINTGTATQILTSDGTGGTYWSTGTGTGGSGTVTSVDIASLTTFLSVGGGPVTTAGILGVDLSGVPLDVAHGGTGTGTATGTGNLVLATSPSLTGPVTVTGNLIVNGNETINSSTGDVLTVRTTMTSTSNMLKLYADALANGNSVYFIVGRNESVNNAGYMGFQLIGVDSTNNFIKFGFFGAVEIMTITATGKVEVKSNLAATSIGTGSFSTPGGVGLGGDLFVGKTINLVGSSSGTVKIQTQAAAGVYNFNLPTSAGTAGQVLVSGGGLTAPMVWSSVAAGSVTSIGMTVPSFLTVNPATITTTGTFVLGYSGTPLPVTSGGTGVTTSTGTGNVVLSNDPLFVGGIPIFGESRHTKVLIQGQYGGGGLPDRPLEVNNFTTATTFTDVLITAANMAANGTEDILIGKTLASNFMVYYGYYHNNGTPTGRIGIRGQTPSMLFYTPRDPLTFTEGSVVIPSGGMGVAGNIFSGGTVNAARNLNGAKLFIQGGTGADSTSEIRISSGTDFILNVFKEDLVSGQTGWMLLGRTSGDNLCGGIGFHREDTDPKGSRLEFAIRGPAGGFAGTTVGIYKAFISSGTWFENSVVVDGGLGTSGSITLLEGNFTVDKASGGTGGLETHPGDVFRYNTGTTTMNLECVGHTINNLVTSQKWTRMGNITYVYFDATFDISDGPPADLIWTNLPTPPLGIACAPLSIQTDLQPNTIFNKTYFIEADPLVGARFYRVGTNVNLYQQYDSIPYTNIRIVGMLTYPGDPTF